MNMKKMMAGLLALVLCLGALAGCSSEAGNESAPAESPSEAITDAVESGKIDGATVGVLVVTTQSQWCNDLIAGVKEVCETNGMQVIVSDSQVSVDQEIAGMENLINAGLRRHRSQLHERRRPGPTCASRPRIRVSTSSAGPRATMTPW